MIGRIAAATLAIMSVVTPQLSVPTPAPETSAVDVALTTSDGSIAYVMGGMFVPTPGQNLLAQIAQGYLIPHGITGSVQALTTPETPFYGTYQDGEAILAQAVRDAAPGSTFVGYSQSAGIIGMFLRDHADAIKPGDHFVAFAPPTMPDSGQFTAAMDPAGYWATAFGADAAQNFPAGLNTPLPEGATIDVFCGLYDPYCNTLPSTDITNGMNYFWASLNAQAAAWIVHINYPSYGPDQFDNAVAITGPGYGDGDGPVNFWLTPDQDMHTLPMFAGLKLFDWLNGGLSVTLSNIFRPWIDAAYENSPLYDAMMGVEHLAGIGL